MCGSHIQRDGRTIRTSRSLRGLLDYARVSRVAHVAGHLVRDPYGPDAPARGVLTVTYADGATGGATFVDYRVMAGWVRNRRSWHAYGCAVDLAGAPRQFVIRICKATGAPELFFYDGGELTVYARIGQHSTASVDYLRRATRLERTLAEIEACVSLAHEWQTLPGSRGVEWVRVSRLARGGA